MGMVVPIINTMGVNVIFCWKFEFRVRILFFFSFRGIKVEKIAFFMNFFIYFSIKIRFSLFLGFQHKNNNTIVFLTIENPHRVNFLIKSQKIWKNFLPPYKLQQHVLAPSRYRRYSHTHTESAPLMGAYSTSVMDIAKHTALVEAGSEVRLIRSPSLAGFSVRQPLRRHITEMTIGRKKRIALTAILLCYAIFFLVYCILVAYVLNMW